MDVIGLSTERKNLIFWCTCTFLSKITWMLDNQLEFHFIQKKDPNLGVIKELNWVQWSLLMMMKYWFGSGWQQRIISRGKQL